MNKSHSFQQSGAPHWEPKFPFDLVIAYEDHGTRDRAMLLYDRIAQQLTDDYDFQCAWWKLEHLRDPSLMEQAIEDAVQANMIIVALHDGRSLPKAAADWLDAWAPNKFGNKSALVALLSRPPNAPPCPHGRQAFLQRVARQARMDFFVHCAEAGSHAPLLSAESIGERAAAMTPFLESLLRTPPPPTLRA
ncbi:MAG: hypothetical protein JXQ71_13665 [Verrucomicrobia bacterium]|nr:hypothetical protein [Verrucomicrobiota bacterium]